MSSSSSSSSFNEHSHNTNETMISDYLRKNTYGGASTNPTTHTTHLSKSYLGIFGVFKLKMMFMVNELISEYLKSKSVIKNIWIDTRHFKSDPICFKYEENLKTAYMKILLKKFRLWKEFWNVFIYFKSSIYG